MYDKPVRRKFGRIVSGKLGSACLLIALFVGTPACSDMLETSDGNAVNVSRHYNDFNDADKAILGIYGKLMGLVDRVILLNELRADLLDITDNSTDDQVMLNNHIPNPNNKYCDLSPFYEVILNCNDALYHFDEMLAANKISKTDYDYRFADVMAVRCWLYLQMAIHFGNIPYVTEPLEKVADVNDPSRFPVLSLEDVLARLIASFEPLPKGISFSSPLIVAGTIDNYAIGREMLLNKHMVMGDLYLWNNQYVEAATQYFEVINEAETKNIFGAILNREWAYKLDVWTAADPRLQIAYINASDITTLRNNWKTIFSRASTDAMLQREVFNMFVYYPKFSPQYPLIEIFANTGKGKYQVRPSQWAMDSLWNAQLQRGNGVIFDARGRQAAFDQVNDQPVVIKYLYSYYPQETGANSTIFLNYASTEKQDYLQGNWYIYRAGLLNLRYAEAANRAGYPDLALQMLNNGMGGVNIDHGYPFRLLGNSAVSGADAATWRNSGGLRRRAYIANAEAPGWVQNFQDTIKWVEEALITEAALECGFEGYRWGDILRVTRRKNSLEAGSGTSYLNSLIAPKFTISGKAAPSLSPDNWFLTRRKD
jgi:hypothetical protein